MVAVDGVDGAGKTVFAGELAQRLRVEGAAVLPVTIDGFHNPAEVRHRRGRDSPEGFYADSYDLEGFERLLLGPLATGGDRRIVRQIYDVTGESPVGPAIEAADDVEVLVVDGIFLHRPELIEWWDLSIWLEVPFEVSVPRGARRDGGHPDPDAPPNRRYVDGQRLYQRRCDPRGSATWVVDNKVLDDAHIVRGPV